ncbi:MAG: hypothetical protein QM690_14455 [Sphingobium sp.]
MMTAIVVFLQGCWPDPVNMTPCNLTPSPTDRLFLEAALALQDDGAIMYEAMLVGVETRPCLRDTILTRKGQLLFLASQS